MSNVEKISVSLTPEMAAMVNDAVLRGEYASSSEVIREALRQWNRQRGMAVKAELRRLWDEGIKSGPSRHGSIQAIKRAARKQTKA